MSQIPSDKGSDKGKDDDPDRKTGVENGLKFLRPLSRGWRFLTQHGPNTRLRNTLPVVLQDCTYRAEGSSGGDWRQAASKLLGHAQKALNDHRGVEGWKCLKAADRYMLYGLSEEDLQSRARTVAEEAKTIGSPWRMRAIEQLLGGAAGSAGNPTPAQAGSGTGAGTAEPPGAVGAPAPAGNAEPGGDAPDTARIAGSGAPAVAGESPDTEGAPPPRKVSAGTLFLALQILHERQDIDYYRLNILRTRIMLLGAVAIGLIGCWVAIAPGVPPEGWDGPEWRWFWLTVVVVGLMGAATSSLTSSLAKGKGQGGRIPEELHNTSTTVARLAVGPLSAIAVTMFLLSGILTIHEQKPQYMLILCGAFVAGFTERLVKRAVESVAGESTGVKR